MDSSKVNKHSSTFANNKEILKIFICNFSVNQFIRFLVIGSLNSLFGFAVYSFVIFAGGAVWISLLLSTLLGSFFNFVTYGRYVFRELIIKQLPSFLICYLTIYIVNLILINLILNILINKILIQFILLLPMSLFSYFLFSRLVFKKQGILNASCSK